MDQIGAQDPDIFCVTRSKHGALLLQDKGAGSCAAVAVASSSTLVFTRILTDRPPHRLVSSAAWLGEPLGWARGAAHGQSKQGSREGTHPMAQGGGTEG